MNDIYLKKIRKYELIQILSNLEISPKESKILDIGCGSGKQIQILNSFGFQTSGIDIVKHKKLNTNDVNFKKFDGINIPFKDNEFNVVLMSHVLEHVIKKELLISEIKRILKNNGTFVCVLPNHYWRIYTSLTHYINILKTIFFFKRKKTLIRKKLKKPKIEILQNLLLSPKHGVIGNRLTEAYYFSPFFWKKFFKNNNFKLIKYYPSFIFYTGNINMGLFLKIKYRILIAFIFGSTSHIYILKK